MLEKDKLNQENASFWKRCPRGESGPKSEWGGNNDEKMAVCKQGDGGGDPSESWLSIAQIKKNGWIF